MSFCSCYGVPGKSAFRVVNYIISTYQLNCFLSYLINLTIKSYDFCHEQTYFQVFGKCQTKLDFIVEEDGLRHEISNLARRVNYAF